MVCSHKYLTLALYLISSAEKLTMVGMKFSLMMMERICFQSVVLSPNSRQMDSSASLTAAGGLAMERTSTRCCFFIDFTANQCQKGEQCWLGRKQTVSKAQQSTLDLYKCFNILNRNMRLFKKQILLNKYFTRHTSMNVSLPNGHRQLTLPKNDSLKPVICLLSLMNGQLDCMLSVQQQGITSLSTAGLLENKPQATEGVSRIRLVPGKPGQYYYIKGEKWHKNHSFWAVFGLSI